MDEEADRDAAAEEAADHIASAGDTGDVFDADDRDDGNQESDKSEKTDKTPAPSETNRKKDDAAKSDEDKAREEAAKKEEAIKERRKKLGLDILQPAETVESLREKLRASSTEAKSLAAEKKAIEAFFKEQKLLLNKGKDGKFALIADKDYQPAISAEQMADVYSRLSKEDKELFDADPVKGAAAIAKHVVTELAGKMPKVSDQPVYQEIEAKVQDRLFDEMAKATFDDKSPRYPNLADDDVVDLIAEQWNSDIPVMQDLKKFMLSSEDAYKLGMDLLYAKAWRVVAPEKIKAAELAKQKEAEAAKNKKKPTIAGAGLGGSDKGGGGNDADAIADRIAGTGKGMYKK